MEPTPHDLGLPQREFRPVQLYALDQLQRSDKRYLLVQAPTGSGKSLIAAALARMAGLTSVYTCATIDLQRQFCESVPFAREIKGRANYPTLDYPHLFPAVSCEHCDKRESNADENEEDKSKKKGCSWCHNISECPYEHAKAEALKSGMAVLNIAYFLNEANHVGRFSGFDLGILDEGDEVERKLMDFIALEFTPRLLNELGIRPPEFKGTTANMGRRRFEWGGWLDRVDVVLADRIQVVARDCANMAHHKEQHAQAYARTLKHLVTLKRIRKRVQDVRKDLSKNPESWVRVDDRLLVFKPVRVDRYAHQYLWRHAKRWLVMSATLISREQFCEDLGLDESEVEWIDLPSTFPVANRPVFYWPAAEVTYKTTDQVLPRLVDHLDKILAAYQGVRVLVHTHTYRIATYLAEHSRYQDRVLTYRSRDEYDAVLEAFKAMDNAVLIAPSMERGVDLFDDLCRCVVVCKIPFPNLSDRQVQARFRSRWYDVQTVRALVQMTGRGVRHDTDWSDSWILDAEFARLRRRAWHLFPEWWREAVTVNPAAIQAALRRAESAAGRTAATERG